MKPFPYSSANAVVTGAASGIGLAIARQLAGRGVTLLLADWNEAALSEAAAELATKTQVESFVGDLALHSTVDSLADRALAIFDGEIDLLVNNAGVAWYGPTAQMPSSDCEQLLAVNLLAPIRLTQRLLPAMLSRPRAHVVHMASVFGLFTRPYTAAYHASKFGLVGYGSALRSEFGIQGLGVTTVCPGFVRTNLFESGRSGFEDAKIPHPPAWLGCSPEQVATATLRGIDRNRRLVLVTWFASFAYGLQRFAPWLVDSLQHWQWWHKRVNPTKRREPK